MKLNKLLLALAASGIATSAFATNGYFATGVGVKAKGMGGASIAFAEDGFGAAANPANLAQVADGYSVGVSAFAPDRGISSSSVSGAYIGQNVDKNGNETSAFAIPEFAYAKKYNDKINYGVVVYGNGGMNVEYAGLVYDSAARTSTNLEQLFIAPTVSYKVNDQHTVAASLNLVYQTFEATGLNMFTQYSRGAVFSSGAFDATNNPFGYTSGGTNPGGHGQDSSTGAGVKLGWLGKLNENLSIGAFYQPETSMGKFDKYSYLFAERGGFNIPTTYGLGVSIKANPATTVALDVTEIKYGDIKSLANTNNHIAAVSYVGATQLGNDDGKGFGWSDMTVYKLGIAHQVDDKTTIRGGWNYGKQPISVTQLDFSALAPAVVEHHFTFGATRALDKDSSISMHAMWAPKVVLDGVVAAGTGTYHIDKLQMSQYEIGLQYSKKF
jgi:long-chain fatty acid transport protein